MRVMLFKYKNSQSAFEFLVTYGWALMAILIAIGALAYFGITGTANVLPDKCIFSNNIQCVDYRYIITAVPPQQLQLNIRNSLGSTIYNVGADVYSISGTTTSTCNLASGNNVTFQPGQNLQYSCNPNGANFPANAKAKLKVKVRFSKVPSGGFEHSAMGDIYTTVQP
jgi:hypothetical protein